MRLENSSRVAVIGGGPAGSFFSYFLLDLASKVGLDLQVDIYEPRDFSLPAPQGCNMCAGVISETLVQNLATEGINLPASLIQNAIDSYLLHTDIGSQRIDSILYEKRIGVAFRGAGPRNNQDLDLKSFDNHLLSLAKDKGANIIRARVTGVKRCADGFQVEAGNNTVGQYSFLVVATGVNTNALKLLEGGESKYSAPKTTKTAIREYYLGRDIIEKTFGDSLHVFLLDIPRLDFALIIPKGDYVSICLLGKDIDEELLQAFLTSPEVKGCFPDGWQWDQPNCRCMPRINIQSAKHPYADRVVFIGDSGVTRLYKDGIGAAYRAAKAAATCAVLEGISSEDFERHYDPFCKRVVTDNYFGSFIFFMTHILQRMRFSRKALLRVMVSEQQSPGNHHQMGNVLWDMFTGSAPYLDIFLRILRPAFLGRFLWSLIVSI